MAVWQGAFIKVGITCLRTGGTKKNDGEHDRGIKQKRKTIPMGRRKWTLNRKGNAPNRNQEQKRSA